MKVTIWKNEKESNERAITRFNKKVQASRKVLKVRTSRYHTKAKTKTQVRGAAIMREHYRTQNKKHRFY